MTERLDWHTDGFPELRAAPPWVMQEMITASPALLESLLATPPAPVTAAAELINAALAQDMPVTVCGCGTSEHAAHGIATMLAAAVGPETARLVRARPSFSAAQDPAPGVCLAVSHDGETRATLLATAAARSAGSRTILVTHVGEGGIADAAELVVRTPTHDDSWCHTLAYTSALGVGAALAARLGAFAADPTSARDLLQRAAGDPGAVSVAARLADRRVVLCAGAEAADLTTARELALKIAEATHIPTIALELETVLHGELAACEPSDGLVLVAIEGSTRATRRAVDVARATAAIGMPVAALLSDTSAERTGGAPFPGGTVVAHLPAPGVLAPSLGALVAGAGMLQAITLELAHARGTNPDLIRREQEPYRRAAAEAEASTDW